MSEPLLGCRALSLSLGKRQVLHDVDFALRPGEVVALLGPNGSGKTTLVRALAGVISGSGEVFAPAPRARHVAYLAQSEPLPEHFRVEEVVALGRAPFTSFWRDLLDQGRASDASAVQEALRATGADALVGRFVGELSGGERQRVALARALAQEPRVLLLDEPLTHLDVRYQMELLATLLAARARGVAVVVVLHELALAPYADRCVLLHDGRVVADDEPRGVLRPESLERVFGVPFEVEERGERLHVAARLRMPTPSDGSASSSAV